MVLQCLPSVHVYSVMQWSLPSPQTKTFCEIEARKCLLTRKWKILISVGNKSVNDLLTNMATHS